MSRAQERARKNAEYAERLDREYVANQVRRAEEKRRHRTAVQTERQRQRRAEKRSARLRTEALRVAAQRASEIGRKAAEEIAELEAASRGRAGPPGRRPPMRGVPAGNVAVSEAEVEEAIEEVEADARAEIAAEAKAAMTLTDAELEELLDFWAEEDEEGAAIADFLEDIREEAAADELEEALGFRLVELPSSPQVPLPGPPEAEDYVEHGPFLIATIVDHDESPPRAAWARGFTGADEGQVFLLQMQFRTPGVVLPSGIVLQQPGPWSLPEAARRNGDRVWTWPFDWGRLFTFLKSLKAGDSREYKGKEALFQWVRLPAWAPAQLYHGERNCAIELLAARFPSKERELRGLKLSPTGGFSEVQASWASQALKRNIEVRDRAGGLMFAAGDYTPYKTHTRPVVVYAYEDHAVGEPPRRPKAEDIAEVRLVGWDPSEDYFRVRRLHGDWAQIWQIPGGAVVKVEAQRGHRGPGGWVGAREEEVFAVRNRALHERIEGRATELGYEGDITGLASPFSVEAAVWRAKNGYEATPKEWRSFCKAANLNPRPYCHESAPPGETVDINSAYESSPWAGARDWFARYGMPRATAMVMMKDAPVEALARVTGFALVELDLERCHPWVRHVVNDEPRGVYTTLRLQFWLESGAAAIMRVELLLAAVKYHPEGERPEGAAHCPPTKENKEGRMEEEKARRYWGRAAIGRLIPRETAAGSLDYHHVASAAEAASITSALIAKGTLGTLERVRPKAPLRARAPDDADIEEMLAELAAPEEEPEDTAEAQGYWRIGEVGEAPRGCYHAHAYYLDYTALVVDREVFAHPWEEVVKVKTDSITLVEGKAFTSAVVIGRELGEWKVVPKEEWVRQKYGSWAARPLPGEWATRPYGPKDVPVYWEPLLSQVHIVEGPPGYGKTYHCLEHLEGTQHVALVPTRRMRRKLAAAHPGLRVLTWQWALHPRPKFAPEVALQRVAPTTLYIGEVGQWPRDRVKELFPWLIENGYRIVADGDRRQMAPVQGCSPWGWLDSQGYSREERTARDWRSKEGELAAFKNSLRGRTNREVLDLLAATQAKDDYASFVQEWHPYDYVYVTTHAMRAAIEADLAYMHRRRYPEKLVRVAYSQKSKAKSGEEEYIALDAAPPSHSSVAYTTTYSSCQGETAGVDMDGRAIRVWLVDDRIGEWIENAAYTAATRVEHMAQYGLVVKGLPSCDRKGNEREDAPDEALDARQEEDDAVFVARVKAFVRSFGRRVGGQPPAALLEALQREENSEMRAALGLAKAKAAPAPAANAVREPEPSPEDEDELSEPEEYREFTYSFDDVY